MIKWLRSTVMKSLTKNGRELKQAFDDARSEAKEFFNTREMIKALYEDESLEFEGELLYPINMLEEKLVHVKNVGGTIRVVPNNIGLPDIIWKKSNT